MSQAGKQAGTGALGGAATGASTGAMFGPYGAAIGAGVGGLAGGVSGYFKGKGDDNRQKAKKEAWAKAQQTLAASRAQQIAGRGQLMQQAYSPAANMMGQMYGENMKPGLANPLGPTDAGPADERYVNGHRYPKPNEFNETRLKDFNETKLKTTPQDEWNVEIGQVIPQEFAPVIGPAQMKPPPKSAPKKKGKK